MHALMGLQACINVILATMIMHARLEVVNFLYDDTLS